MKTIQHINLCLLTLLFSVTLPSHALNFSSPPHAATVIELYTSEGCSSCPPADRWLSTLVDHPLLFKQIFPLAFHVDYWDYLGWKDPFAQKAFSLRQRSLKNQALLKSVYTPGVLTNSKEWQGWRKNRAVPNPTEQPGILSADLHGKRLNIAFATPGKYTLHMAYLGMGLTSKVTAGENNRRVLKHDFVVLKHWQEKGAGKWQVSLPEQPNLGQQNTVLTVWLTPQDSDRIIQATGSTLPKS